MTGLSNSNDTQPRLLDKPTPRFSDIKLFSLKAFSRHVVYKTENSEGFATTKWPMSYGRCENGKVSVKRFCVIAGHVRVSASDMWIAG